MARLRREAIFEARIEYSGNRRFDPSEDRHVEDLVIRTLLEDLPRELDTVFGLRVQISIRGKRYSSLSVFFGVVLGAYEILSRYKGFYDSIELIQQQAYDLLRSALGRVSGDLSVSVASRVPSRESLDPERSFFRHRLLRSGWAIGDEPPSSRDGFFYFLLVFSLVELLVIGLLVYGAVMRTYFGHGG